MLTSENNRINKSSFPKLWNDLRERFMAPIGQVTFWVFLIFGILGFSACGIWIEVGKYFLSTCRDLNGIQTAFFTFVPAVACTSTMQIMFTDKEKKYFMSFGYAVGVLMLLLPIGLLIFIERIPSTFSLSMGVILSIAAIITWWIAYGLDPVFNDNAGENPETGGDTSKVLPGNVHGFKTN